MENRILMITSRQLCYNSAAYFADALAKSFTKLGIEVEFCRMDDTALPQKADEDLGRMDESYDLDPEIADQLDSFIGKKYLAVIDFNSRLPRILMDDGSNYLDNIDAPFFDYLLDNPFYHHKSLRCSLKNYNVITVDEHHADYIRRYYPNIRSVNVQTIGADEYKEWVPFEEKENTVLLAGTYRNPSGYRAVMDQVVEHGDPMGTIMMNMSDMLLADDDLTMEEALRKILEQMGYEDESHRDPLFASQMHEFYTVEKYARHYYRDSLLWCLIANHVPLRVMGTHWHLFPGLSPDNLKVILPVEYGRSYQKIAGHKILADVSPFFKSGIHDRLPVGFSVGTPVLTDDNEYKRRKLDKLDIMHTYTLQDVLDPARGKAMCDDLLEFMADKKRYDDMRERAHELWRENYTWEKTAENILNMIMAAYRN